jgi:hypothetical protein
MMEVRSYCGDSEGRASYGDSNEGFAAARGRKSLAHGGQQRICGERGVVGA